MCSKPFRLGNDEYGCGACEPCLINRKRLWTARLMLEQNQHSASCFLTLTYSDEFLPVGGTLLPRDSQLFLKRLRYFLDPIKIRYYLVGEYGDVTQRPHYHLALFGYDPADHIRGACSCLVCRSWDRGIVDVGDLTSASCAYVVGYILKGMTRKSDFRLDGRHPEFARMSLRPGIGGDAVQPIVDVVQSKEGSSYVATNGNVPGVVRLDGRAYPLGRYLMSKTVSQSGNVLPKFSTVRVVREPEEHGADFAARVRADGVVRDSRRVQQSRNAVGKIRFHSSKRGVRQ